MDSASNTFWKVVGWLLGSDAEIRSIDEFEFSFAAPWARSQTGPAWIFFGCLGLAALAAFFYFRHQTHGRRRTRLSLAVIRGTLLCLLLLVLAEPVLNFIETRVSSPVLWVMVDGTDSMGMKDKLPPEERQQLLEAVSWKSDTPDEDPARIDLVKALFNRQEGNVLKQLDEKFDLRMFVMDREDGVRAVPLTTADDNTLAVDKLSGELAPKAPITDLAAAFGDLETQHSMRHLAGLVVISDFNDTTDISQEGESLPLRAAGRLDVPVYTIGVGPRTAVDLSAVVQPPPVMKKDERSNIVATLRYTGLEGQSVNVKLAARQLTDDEGDAGSGAMLPIEEKTVELTGSPQTVEFQHTPTDAGRFEFVVEVDELEGEVVTANNRHQREVQVRDDFMRLLFVEYEPTWEWRFIKEVFHRDKLVGMRGFRTYLRSSDPKVRETNELFLRTLTPPRSEFFANDVIVLGGMPASALSTNFCNLVKEFVSEFGGGLVVIADPRFGPSELAQTPLADLLPVVLDPSKSIRDQQEFRLQLDDTGTALFDFMRLGSDEAEHQKAWNNLGPLPWYQPVRHLHPGGSFVLAEHPEDLASDKRQKQPIIAIRDFGRGQVVWLGFNETWRLRRRYGELYYRQFWAQMIHHLGLRHAMGDQKRFVVRTDKKSYKSGDKLLLTVEAYDQDYKQITAEKLRELGAEEGLTAQWVRPDEDGGELVESKTVPLFKDGIFEVELPIYGEGEHRIRVQDPVADDTMAVNFRVSKVDNERRHATRDYRLQQQIADTTSGRSYELTNVFNLPNDIDTPRIEEVIPRVISLWDTPLCFLLIVGLMLGEWLTRKMINLP